MRIINAIIAFLSRLRNKSYIPPVEIGHNNPPPEFQMVPEKPSLKEKDHLGSMFYMGDLLDNLQKYFVTLKKFKRYDRDAYDLYRATGAQVSNSSLLLKHITLDPSWKKERPSFFALFFSPADKEDEVVHASLIYFQKVKQPQRVELFDGDIYDVNLFYEDVRKKGNINAIGSFHIGLHDGSSEPVLLREIVTTSNVFKIRTSRKQRKRNFGKPYYEATHSSKMKYPSFIDEMVREYLARNKEFVSPEWWAVDVFKIAANHAVNAWDGLQVAAVHNDLVAAFNIDTTRTPYFFSDREKTYTENGVTKKIFHYVKEHLRTVGDKTIIIKEHFRGLRKFKWNGYLTTIKDPRTSLDFMTANYKAEIVEDGDEVPAGTLSAAEVGNMLFKQVSA